MGKRALNSQITSRKTQEMYIRQTITLAKNVFEFENLPEFIDIAYLNSVLLNQGSIAFFYDDIMGLIALPYIAVNGLDIYGRPRTIQVTARNGYTRILNSDEYVIMYDNTGCYPLYLDILQYAHRIALIQRIIDINIIQQKTPRIIKCKNQEELSIKKIINDLDADTDLISTYEDLDLEQIDMKLAPAPFVSDKLEEQKQKLWNEFLRLIGIANLTVNKKERSITDEIMASQGGTIASRFSRYTPRKKAVDMINKKWGDKLKKEIIVKYYDGIQSTEPENENDFSYEKEVDINDL